jgi:outer membrane receptor protein involved in Fe transport
MRLRKMSRLILLGWAIGTGWLGTAGAQEGRTVRVVGTVRDQNNAIPLPGLPVEVLGSDQIVYTDVDGRYVLELAPGSYEIKVTMDGYQPAAVKVDVSGSERTLTADVSLAMSRFVETVNVVANVIDVETSSAAAQLIERKNAQVITDNIGSQEMKANGDSDAAAAMTRVTGLSVVDNQYVFVRGLGERYSNTTLAGSVLPTTEPDKKVVPLDLFPSGLIDSVQVAKSYSPEKSAEFAGGLVQIVPLKLPNRPVVDLSYGTNFYTTSTGKEIPLSPLGSRDWLGFDNGSRALPSGIPNEKIVRQGIYTPSVGYTPEQITQFGRLFDNTWSPALADGAPGQNWSVVLGNRFDKLGLIGSMTHSYKEQFVEENRRFYRVAGANNELEATTDYDMQYGTEKAQLGIVGNVAYQFTPNHRLSLENFYSHSGRDEGRFFQGPNTDNAFIYQNYRLQFIEEGVLSNAVSGDHFFQNWHNSRFDWRVNYANAKRDEPDLRETLYQIPIATPTVTPVLADESQSGFRMFNELDDKTLDLSGNWSVLRSATQYKFGLNYVDRTRDFQSRRFRYVPIILNKDGAAQVNLTLPPEQLFTTANIGTAFRLNEETRPVDGYDGDLSVVAGYGMVDVALTGRSRFVAGARVERFDQTVNTFDPFGLFIATITAENNNTDVFPSVNFVQSLNANTNLRLSYSGTVNRPEFRELAEFEFTDVVGNRAVKGNPDLERALIQNVDARWETFRGDRSVVAASVFYKYFDQPIERVVLAAAQPITTFQNAESARNFGLEFELGQSLGRFVFLSANYTFVDSKITLRPEQATVQTSTERALAGQSKNLFNLSAEFSARGFSTRLLFNYFDDRISDVGANDAPDIIEEGRGSLDLVFGQRFRDFNIRLNLENLTDSEWLYTQGLRDQRSFKLGRTIGVSFSYSLF